MQSFGDDTLAACLRVETNSNVKREESDIGKYFKESLLLVSKSSDKSHQILDSAEQSAQAKQNSKVHATSISKTSSLQKNLKHNVSSKSSLSTRNNRITRCTQNKVRRIKQNASTERKLSGQVLGKENLSHISINKSENSKNVPLGQVDSSELNIEKSKNCSSISINGTGNDTSSKLLASNVSNQGGRTIERSSYLSTIPTQDRCKLAVWGLPPNILEKYEARGVSNMFPWQVECLSNHRVIEERCNLVYSAPTSAGKTLVAEILVIKTVLETKKKVIFILPFVSVVREKMYYFQDLLSDSGIRVEGFMGGVTPVGGFAATHVAIATIEKANSLINRLMEEDELVNLGAVVIDELHLVGDPYRGYLLELLLTKLKYMTLRNDSINIQLIGMSATLPNLSLLAEWLNAELYKTDYRPVPLNEQCKIGSSIFDSKMNLLRELEPMPELTMDSDNILQLCIETISDGHSTLIFCPTKNWCEKLAEQIAFAFFKLGREDTEIGKMLRQQLNRELISETLEQLKRSPTGLDSVLKNTVSFGIAFHHAGLTMDERDILEGSFRSGSLRVLVATSTLSSGVNLPARRVIIRTPIFGGKLLDSLSYKQMIGRAGRMGKDTAGESILMCKPNERKGAESLLSATLDPIKSCLEDSAPLIRALLEAVASEVVYTPSDVEIYANCTLISMTGEGDARNPAIDAINFLVDNEFLLLQKTEQEHRWVATALGKACLAASIPPKDGLFLLEELQKARRCFVLDTELHVVYLVTPINSGSQISTIDWMTFLEFWRSLSESERRVGQLVGVEERFLTSAIRGVVRPGKLLSIHRRFYTALALHDLVRETPLSTVCKRYGCGRGILQSLQQSASTFAGMVTQFCKQLGWDCMELLVSQFQARLQFGVCRELLDLLRLPMLNGLRARSLYKQGITTVAELAMANELDVERALYKALPFESEKEQDGEHEVEASKRNKMRTVFVTGRDGLTPHEAAALLVQEARALVQNELRLQDIQWDQNSHSSISSESTSTSKSCTQQTTFGHAECTNSKANVLPSIQETNSQEEITESCNLIQNKETEILLEKDEETNLSKSHEVNNSEILDNSVENSENNGNALNEQSYAVKPSDKTLLDCINIFECSMRKGSLDFFDDSSPKLRKENEEKRNSESLISFKATQRHHNKTVSTTTSRGTVGNSENVSDIPTKKLKSNDLQSTNEKAMTSSNSIFSEIDLDINTQTRVSRSPDLFDDSLNVDTQMCNILDENVMDTLEFSDFNEPYLPDSKAPRISANHAENSKTNAMSGIGEIDSSAKGKSKKRLPQSSLDASHSQAKPSTLLWKDDSWNDTKCLMNKVNQLNEKNCMETPPKCNVRNIKNIKNSQILDTPLSSTSRSERKNCAVKLKSGNNSTELKKISQRFRSEIPADGSPIANVILFDRKRAASLDSNKSDSDDMIIPSQTIDSPLSMKLRMKLSTQKKPRKHITQILDRKIKKESLPSIATSAENAKPTNEVEEEKKCHDTPDIKSHGIHYADVIVPESNKDQDTKINKYTKSVLKLKGQLKKTESISALQQTDIKTCNDIDETTNWTTLNIVKVGSDRATFNLFKREIIKRKHIALALNCEKYIDETSIIGTKVISSATGERKKRSKKADNFVHKDKKLCGASVSWENNIAYYISFVNIQELKVSGKEQLKLFKELLANTMLYIKCFATKETFRLLYECCEISPSCRFLDPKVASWIQDSNADEMTFNELVTEYFPQGCFMMKRIGQCYNIGPGLSIQSTLPGEFRSSVEAVLTWHITDVLLDKLEKLSPTLLYTFKEVEMQTVVILACMELSGLGICLKSLQDLCNIIREEMASLEQRAFALSKRKFNFSSSREVAEVLGLYEGKKVSVNKAVLQHSDNPIASLVMSWRKLGATQSKIIHPLLNQAQQSSRIHGNCVTCTLTGRVSMHEPNLQNIPKDFNSEDNSFVISVRMAFVPSIGNVILSADYCQLELRILAHFSKDNALCKVMRKPGDIFKNIAATWNKVSEEQVDDKMRQHTKQLCYGMIYGMGTKTLAESLSVDESKAKEFLESFMYAYPGIRQWLDKVLEEARKNGYVTTLLERRRFLPGLTSTNPGEKSQAERQAVNTKVQGSAADIAKKAMVNIEERIRYEFPQTPIIMPHVHATRKLRSGSNGSQLRGGYLVLQLHDELLYEVNSKDVQQVATIVKESMEQVCHLAVPLPVKIKVGPVWGDLSEYHL